MPLLRLPMELEKQPYSVPLLSEIENSPWNGMKVASLFSGGGGSSIGYRMAGYRVVWANEFVEQARQTYIANSSPATIVDPRDIREVKGSEILSACGLSAGELDVLDGSPPCASFSMSGKREKLWGKEKQYSDTSQRTDDLFYEYIRIIDDTRPRSFIAENVSGLVIGKSKGYYLRIFERLKSLGYSVRSSLVDAQWLGVPQRRRRLFFIGIRNDIGIDPEFPKPLPYFYSVAEALNGISNSDEDLEYSSIIGYAVHKEWVNLGPGCSSKKYFNLVRADPNLPCPTITATTQQGSARVTHYSEPRYFTVPELKRLSSFPDDYQVTGTYPQRCERFGRAVPPIMMRAISSKLYETLRGNNGRL